MKNRRSKNTGRNPSAAEIAEAERIASLSYSALRHHPRSIPADPNALRHINTYGELPDFYIDQVFACCDCDRKEIWRAEDQKWYYETTKAHIDARAVRCHTCRRARKQRQP